MKKYIMLLATVAILGACVGNGTSTVADTDPTGIKLLPLNMVMTVERGNRNAHMFINEDTNCIYSKYEGVFVPIAEQEYVYDIYGGKCVGPYQRKHEGS